MRVLIDIGHPAHVHIFKNFTNHMLSKGHAVLFTTRDKEFEKELLSDLGFEFESFGKNFKSKLGKLFGLFIFNIRLLLTAVRFKPDIFLSHGSMYAAQVAWLLRKVHVSLEDSGNMEQIRLYAPFTRTILTPDFLPNNLGSKQIRYKANHELFYLHPNYFKPSTAIYSLLNIPQTTSYAILRFVSWAATHDIGQSGMSIKEKRELINFLVAKGITVFISAERHNLPSDLQKFAITIPPQHMHDALAYACLYAGEGATMASEAGVLGTPSLYISSIERCYNTDQEKFGLVYNFRNFKGVLTKIDEILGLQDRQKVFQERRENFLQEKINPTEFFIWFIENYPQSITTLQNNPRFKL